MSITVTGTPTTTDNAGGTNSSTIVVNVPTGAAVGEVLVCHISSGANNGAVTAPSGWTALQSGPDTFGPTIYGTLAYRVVTGTEAGSYTWTTASSSNKYGATMFRVAGANTTTPFRTSGLATANAKGTSSSIVTGPTLSGVQATDEVFYFWSIGDTASATQAAVTMPSSPWTTIYNRGVSTKGTAGSHATGNQSAPVITGGSANDAYVVIGAAMQAAAPASGSGTLARTGSGSLSFSSALTRTGTIARTGLGALSFTAAVTRTGSLARTGSGGLTLTGSGHGTAGGTLTLAGAATLAFDGSGATHPAGTGTLSLGGTGVLGLGGTPPPVPTYKFRTPYRQRRMPVTLPVTALLNYSVAVLRIAGEWVETEWPTEQQIAAADHYFPGGYELVVDEPTADLLVAAGYQVDGFIGTPPVVGVALVGLTTL